MWRLLRRGVACGNLHAILLNFEHVFSRDHIFLTVLDLYFNEFSTVYFKQNLSTTSECVEFFRWKKLVFSFLFFFFLVSHKKPQNPIPFLRWFLLPTLLRRCVNPLYKINFIQKKNLRVQLKLRTNPTSAGIEIFDLRDSVQTIRAKSDFFPSPV